ncbi:MAG: GntR family transcriptional regulator [Desulfobacula sp.]|jgi:DNA-binding GntR family transcriptional regulator|uniref:GntR family transcriptional regulator n=1 Tax=Desulfobacula sp. TaxID=2593537 RepID=UPI001DD4EAAF|nr:GntR family transcriptional regulator [Desulfobacula sp.]MBT3487626.1 GntR family transcriptional regulator [Desulfobacula sp.]MBT3807187.1 GntR family transcriptional regulator [Desulfobacula sp.]MBT4027422.1 GntR family transcriptional regulator [Desulfobacula sp.]MBT4199426.1 GntR family transcriptional regulator [Desulfobacula sp.]
MGKKIINNKKTKDDFTQEAYMGIRRMFFLNEIIPGQKVSYGDLAKRLKMSTTPVIQALKRLEYQGLVRHESNRGYYTENISLKEIIEIYEFRELIEISLLPKAIERIDNKGLKTLKKALDNHLDAVRDIYLKERLLKDMEFHLILATLSGCTIQINTLKSLFDLLYLKYRGNVLFVTPMDTVDSEHIKLYEYIADSNLSGATGILKKHISNVKKHAIISIEKINKEKTIKSI